MAQNNAGQPTAKGEKMSNNQKIVEEKEVAMVIYIGLDGKVAWVEDGKRKRLRATPCKTVDELVLSAKTSSCQSINVHHLIVNPPYVCIYVGGKCYLVDLKRW